MYVYKDTNVPITFKHPFPGPLYVNLYRGSTRLFPGVGAPAIPIFPNIDMPDGYGGTKVYQGLVLDYKDTRYSGVLRAEWRDQPELEESSFVKNQFIEVIQPIAPLDDISNVITENGTASNQPTAFYQQVKDLENTARLIIEAYTGTKFTSYTGIKYATGLYNLSLLLQDAISVDSITPPLTAELGSSFTYLNIKQAPPEDFTPGFDGVIRVPSDYYKNVQYVVSGTWGVEDIPAPVQEAALILISEMSCNEKLYRDRYLQIVSYADSRFQFNNRAFEGTGNVKADQLLEPYRRGGMIVV